MTRHRASSLLAVALLGAGAAPALALPEGWSAPATLSSTKVSGLQPWAAANARGDLAVAWRARTRAGEVVQIARRPAGASAFSAPITISLPTVSVQGVRVALSANGRILVGWRSKDSVKRSTVNAAFIPTSGTPIRITSYPGALDASGAVNVTFTPTGLAAVGWVAKGPRSLDRPPAFDGRAYVALALPGKRFGIARPLDPKRPRSSVRCANESGTDLAARNDGGVLAWWDCDDDIRDFETTAAQISKAGVIGKSESAGAVSRGPSWSAILPTLGGAAMGVQSVNNDDDQGPNVGTMTRSTAGKWTDGPVTIAGVTPGPFDLPPHILGRARIAGTAGTALSAWVGDDDQVTAMTGSTATTAWDPATVLPTTGDFPIVAGVGVTNARSLQLVFSTRPTVGLSRTLWSSRRLATEPAFGAPEDALHIPQLTGEPDFVLGRSGTGVVVYSEGPKGAARVLAAVVAVP